MKNSKNFWFIDVVINTIRNDDKYKLPPSTYYRYKDDKFNDIYQNMNDYIIEQSDSKMVLNFAGRIITIERYGTNIDNH